MSTTHMLIRTVGQQTLTNPRGMEEIVLAIAFLLVPLLLFFLWPRRGGSSRQPETLGSNDGSVVAAATPSSNIAASSGTSRMRRRPATAASSSNAAAQDADELEEEAEEGSYYTSKSSKKREQKKQDKESRRQAESSAREVRKEKQDRQSELRRRRDEEREAEEHRKEEERRIQKEREEAAVAEEFEKWKGSFAIDTEGTAGENTEEGQSLIHDFVEYIKKHKCVALEDLAAEFHLRTQDCINRIISLEQMGRISGVMDDRGKFICISPQEMKAVADYINREGRVSIAHLARRSNEFIDLESKDSTFEDTSRLDELFQDGMLQPIAMA